LNPNALNSGERQVGERIHKIRRDHVQRYMFAARSIDFGARVLDAGCGCGYGCYLLSFVADRVHGIDVNRPAVEFACEHYAAPNVIYSVTEIADAADLGPFDAVVCLETIEHMEDPERCLDAFRAAIRVGGRLVISTPVKTGRDNPWHKREFEVAEFREFVESRFKIVGRAIQRGSVDPKISAETIPQAGDFQIIIGEAT